MNNDKISVRKTYTEREGVAATKGRKSPSNDDLNMTKWTKSGETV